MPRRRQRAPEVVASVGPLDPVVVLLREFLHRSGAVRAVAVVEGEPGDEPAVVDVRRLLPIEVDIGDRTVLLPHAVELDVPPPELPPMRQLAPFDVDSRPARSRTPPGAGCSTRARCARALARPARGPQRRHGPVRDDPPRQAPLAITARAGDADPLVLALGEEEFEMEDDR